MNAATLEEITEIAAPVTALTLPQRAAVALGTAAHEIKLRELLTNSAGILAVSNKAGREECHTAYMVLKNTRISITNLSDDATEDAKAFTKAVKAEALRLLKITEAEESRLQALRDGFDEAEQARKDAVIAADRARTDAIQADIDELREFGWESTSGAASTLAQVIAALNARNPSLECNTGRYDEFLPIAAAAYEARLIHVTRLAHFKAETEATEAAAKAAREAEAARQLAERQAEAARFEAETARLIAERQADDKRRAAEAAQLAKDRAELAEQKRLAQIEADRVAAATKAKLDAQQAQIARDRREQEAIAQAARDVQAAEVAKFQAEQAAHAAREEQFLHEKEAHAAEVKLAADDLAMQIKRDADHIEALDIDVDFNECRFCDDYDEAFEMDAEINESRCMDAHHIVMRSSCVPVRDLSADDAHGLAEEDDLQFDMDFAEVATIPPTLLLGQISARLGFNLTANFLAALGFEPAGRDKMAVLYHERQFGEICAALVLHIDIARAQAT